MSKSEHKKDKTRDEDQVNPPVEEPAASAECEVYEAEPATASEQEIAVDEAPAEEAEDEIAALSRERDEYKDRWLRAVADQENLRRRTRREVTDAHQFATAAMIEPLLEVLDDFERAEASLETGDGREGSAQDALESYRHGVRLVHDRLRNVLERKGVARIEVAPGDTFDPELHEAVAQLPSDEVESGSIIDVVQAGYRYQERTLRAARVVVAQ